MALQVWLPLNGNFNHQGDSAQNAAQTCTNATFDDGKLGKCLHVKGSAGNKNYYAGLAGATKFSICCWMKINDADKSTYSAYQDFFSIGCNADGSNSDAGIRIEHIAAGLTAMQTELYRNGTTMGGNSWISTYQCDIATWTHIVITFDGNNAYTYKNGTLVGTLAKSSIYTTSYNLNGYLTLGMSGTYVLLNDFRIYDHCLSQQEVREISKGLVLHYPLDNVYNTNIVNKITSTNGYMTGFSTSTNRYGYYNFISSYTGTGSSSWLIPSSQTVGALTEGKTYLWSFDCRVNACSAAMILYARTAGKNNDTTSGHAFATVASQSLVGKGWIHYSATRVATANDTSARLELVSVDRKTSGTVYSCDIDIRNIMIVEASSDLPYVYNEFRTNIVEDCSGFGNNGTASNLEINADSPRYNNSVYFNGTNACIAAGRGAMVTDEITYSIWHNTAIATVRAISCTEGGGWNIETNGNSYLQAPIYASGAYRIAATTIKTSDLGLNTWHMLTATWNGLQTKFYIDGELAAQSTALSTKTPIAYNANNGLFIGGEAGTNQTTPASYCQQKISDVRVYATALSADDIKLLYNRGASIDNAGNLHCGELVEDSALTKQQVKKNTQVKCRNFSELPLKYDDTIYVEPDGSMWVRIVRQNNPTSNKFASTDSFTTSVYKSANTWFYAAFCNYVDKWELMVKQIIQNATSETKYRWVQQYNPMTATYANVARANITYNTSTGYATPATTYGGLYNHGINTKLCANNNSNGNWFGAIGAWGAHAGGIPGWNNTVITTGYEDLYLRIDNVTFSNLPENTKTQFLVSGDIDSTEILEH